MLRTRSESSITVLFEICSCTSSECVGNRRWNSQYGVCQRDCYKEMNRVQQRKNGIPFGNGKNDYSTHGKCSPNFTVWHLYHDPSGPSQRTNSCSLCLCVRLWRGRRALWGTLDAQVTDGEPDNQPASHSVWLTNSPPFTLCQCSVVSHACLRYVLYAQKHTHGYSTLDGVRHLSH